MIQAIRGAVDWWYGRKPEEGSTPESEYRYRERLENVESVFEGRTCWVWLETANDGTDNPDALREPVSSEGASVKDPLPCPDQGSKASLLQNLHLTCCALQPSSKWILVVGKEKLILEHSIAQSGVVKSQDLLTDILKYVSEESWLHCQPWLNNCNLVRKIKEVFVASYKQKYAKEPVIDDWVISIQFSFDSPRLPQAMGRMLCKTEKEYFLCLFTLDGALPKTTWVEKKSAN